MRKYSALLLIAAVAFIGADIRNRFFSGVDPMGKSIQIEGMPYAVVGVANKPSPRPAPAVAGRRSSGISFSSASAFPRAS